MCEGDYEDDYGDMWNWQEDRINAEEVVWTTEVKGCVVCWVCGGHEAGQGAGGPGPRAPGPGPQAVSLGAPPALTGPPLDHER